MATDPTISIDVTKDLESFSALASMLTSEHGAIFTALGELENFASQPAKAAAAAKAGAKLALSAPANWTTSNGIGFSLVPAANCTIGFDTVSKAFPVAMSIDSAKTTNISAGPETGIAYVNIDLDFSIMGAVQGAGTFSGIGVAGKASGSKAATLSFCQPVDDSIATLDAVKKAFSQLILPLDPKCTVNMEIGALAKVSFDGAFKAGVDVTYGLGDFKVSAPSIPNVQQSIPLVSQITLPSPEFTLGAKGSVSFKHTDHFALIVNKTDADTAKLYLVRSSQEDFGASVGINVGITSTDASVTVDPAALQALAQKITGNPSLAAEIAGDAAGPTNDLVTSLNGKLQSLISDATGQAGLTVSLSRQTGHTALFTFDVNLATADLAAESWSALVGGSIVDALALNGFTLEPGSGISDTLKRGSTIQFHLFNLFKFTQVTTFFSNARSEFGKDGTIRIFQDIGEEQQDSTKKALSSFRIHFVATATQDALNNVSNAEVDLQIELAESGSSKDGITLANVLGLFPSNTSVELAQNAMANYLASHPAGKVNLICILKSSAYDKLSFTAYNGSQPTALPHPEDQSNWTAFQSATETLVPDLGFIPNLSFQNWVDFNLASIDKVGSTKPPDRRSPGNINAGTASLPASLGPAPLVSFFLQASAGFMNLCEDLTILASTTAGVDSTGEWNDLLQFLTKVITQDVFISYAKPTAGALLSQCSAGGADASAVADLPANASAITATVTMA
jgi:hypothetical protein